MGIRLGKLGSLGRTDLLCSLQTFFDCFGHKLGSVKDGAEDVAEASF